MVDAAARRDRIVEVAAHMLREQGPAVLTTRGVAEAAGVQVPAIYRLFGDKDGLLEAVAEHVMAAFVSAKAAVVEAATAGGTDPVEDLRAGWDDQIRFGVANPALFRLLSDPDRVMTSPAALSGRRVLEARIHRVALTGRLRLSEQRCVDVVAAAGVGTVQVLVSTPPERRDASLPGVMFEAVLGQILGDPPAAVDEAPSRSAVHLRAALPGLDGLTAAERHLMEEWLDRIIAGQPR